MPKNSNTALIASLALVAAGTIIAGAFVAQPATTSWWTNGREIRVRHDTAPLRRILWQPAHPVASPQNPNTTAVDEYEPRLSADGLTMVFVRRRAGTNADLFTSTLSGSGWSEPAPIDAVNTSADELGPELSSDGSSLFFYSDRPGGLGGFDLWVARRTPDGWGTPNNLGPAVNTRWNEYGPALTPESHTLFFSSNRPRPGEPEILDDAWTATLRERRQRHDYDLFSADMTGPEAGRAQPITDLNTPADEGAPAISPVGDFLYFASDRPGGQGGFDLYRSRLAADTTPNLGTPTSPTASTPPPHDPAIGPAPESTPQSAATPTPRPDLGEPENLGAAVNSASNDMDPGLSTDGFRLFFSSDRTIETAAATPQKATPPTPDAPAQPSPTNTTADPTTDGPTRSADASDTPAPGDPPRYRLWSSGSREVYEETETASRRARIADLWNDLWPWLLLLILALAPLFLLARLLRNDAWRRRLGRLSLLTQCLLASLLIHALIASTLAVWKVGSGVVGALRQSGGTRVMLASSGSAGDVSGQIFGGVSGSETTLASFETPASDLSAAPIQAPGLTDTQLPALLAPAAAPLSVEASRDTSSAVSEAIPAPAPTETPERTLAAGLPTPLAPQASSEPTADPRTSLSLVRAQPAPGAVRSENADLAPPAAADTGSEPTPVRLAASDASDPSTQVTSPSTVNPTATTDLQATAAGVDSGLPPAASATRTEEHAANDAPSMPAGPAAADLRSVALPSSTGTTDVELPPSGAAASSASPQLNLAPDSGSGRASSTPSPTIASADLPPSARVSSMPAIPTLPAPSASTGSGSREEGSGLPFPQLGAPSPAPVRVAAGSPAPTGATQAPPRGGTERAPGRLALSESPSSPTNSPSATPSFSGAASSAPPAPGLHVGAALPSINAPARGAASDRTASHSADGTPGAEAGGGSALDPLAALGTPNAAPGLSIPGPSTTGSREVAIGPGSRNEAAGIGPLGLPMGSSSDRSTGPSVSPLAGSSIASLTPSASGTDAGGMRLPDLPNAEGPTSAMPIPDLNPVEKFALRAPEVRSEVLERMGGSEKTEKAVGLALEWFARHQEPDGRWTGRRFDAHCSDCGSPAEFDADAAMTGMALLCYLGAGHTHQSEGPYRDRVDKALRWLVSRQGPDGDLRRGETMYGQTVAAVALCEALGMTKDPRLVEPTRRAVQFVLETAARPRQRQRSEDTSVIGWLVMTIESARRAGIEVPRTTLDAAERWLDSVGAPSAPGRYAYRAGEAPSAAMTAEAMFVRQLVGHQRTERRMQESADFILRTPPKWGNNAPTYHWYYATLALFEHQGDAWKQWNEAMVPALVDHQRTEGGAAGSWDPQDEWSRMGGRIYQTAVCTLSLEVYYRYKPR